MHSYNLRVRLSTILALLLLASCRTSHPVTPTVKPLTPDVSQKLDQGLRDLAETARSKDPTSLERAAKEKNIALVNGLVPIQLTADKVESVPALEKLITDSGGQVKTHLNVAIFASIPPVQIEKIAADPRVWNITLPNSAYLVVH